MGNSKSSSSQVTAPLDNPDNTITWAATVGYGSILDTGLYNDEIIQALITKLNLATQVNQLSTFHLPSGAPTSQQATEYRNLAKDFWTVTSVGVLEDGNTSTLGAIKPQSIARLVESLQSFVVASKEQTQLSHKIAQRLMVTHKLNDAVRLERELANNQHSQENKRQAAEGDEVGYEPSTELGMFFLSSLLACTKKASNIQPDELESLLDSLQTLFDPSESSFFQEWSPPPSLPRELPINSIASTARSETGTARGTERGSPVFQDDGTAWISRASERLDQKITWEVSFDIDAPIAVSSVRVRCLNPKHVTISKYEDVDKNNVMQPKDFKLCLGTCDENMIRVETTCVVLKSDSYNEYVFRLPNGGRTASQLCLEMFMENQKQVAVSFVMVKASSEGTPLPVPRDRRKTIEDLNTWIHSIVQAASETETNHHISNTHVIQALKCQAAITIRSGSLGSLLCLCECLLKADQQMQGTELKQLTETIDLLVERVSTAAVQQLDTRRAILKSSLKYHSSQEKRGTPSILTPFDAQCVRIGSRFQKYAGVPQKFIKEVQSRFRNLKSLSSVVQELLDLVMEMACAHTMDEDSTLEREFSIEFHREIFVRINSLLTVCSKMCLENKGKRITATKYSEMAHSLLIILGSCFRRFAKSNTSLETSTVDINDVLIDLKSTLTHYLTNNNVQENCRHASAGCLDIGFELLYTTSLERVAMVANVFEEYHQKPFATSDGRHMVLIHSLHRLRRTGGSASMLPKPNDILSVSDIAKQVRPVQSWLSLLQHQKMNQEKKNSGLLSAAKQFIGSGATSSGVESIDVDPSTEAAGLLASLFRHLCVLVGDRLDRTSCMGDGSLLDMPIIDGVTFDPDDHVRIEDIPSPESVMHASDSLPFSSSLSSSNSYDSSLRSYSSDSNHSTLVVEPQQAAQPPEITADLQAMITEGILTQAQALSMLGWDGPVPSTSSTPPASSTTATTTTATTTTATTATTRPPGPRCPNTGCTNPMWISNGALSGFYRSYTCNGCRRTGNGERWICREHRNDYCFECYTRSGRRQLPVEDVFWNFANRSFLPNLDRCRSARNGVKFNYHKQRFYTWTCPSVAKSSGKWYYEITILKVERMTAPQFGFGIVNKFDPKKQDKGVGDCRYSWAVDGIRKGYWHNGTKISTSFNHFPVKWENNTTVQLYVDIDAKKARFATNGKLHSNVIKLDTLRPGDSLMPTVTANGGQFRVKVQAPIGDPISIISGYKSMGSMGSFPSTGSSVYSVDPVQPRNNETKTSTSTEVEENDLNGYDMKQINSHFTDGSTFVSSTKDNLAHPICIVKGHGKSFYTFAPTSINLTHGSYYYEVKILQGDFKKQGHCFVQLGWYNVELFDASNKNEGLGDDREQSSWAVDGERLKYWCGGRNVDINHQGWKKNTIIGCYIKLDSNDSSKNSIAFTFGGRPISPECPSSFRGFKVGQQGMRPGLSIVKGEYEVRLHAPFQHPPGSMFQPVLQTLQDRHGSLVNLLDSTQSRLLSRRGGIYDVRTGWRARLYRLDVVGKTMRETWLKIIQTTDMHYNGQVSKFAAPSRLLLAYSQMILMESIGSLKRCTHGIGLQSKDTKQDKFSKRHQMNNILKKLCHGNNSLTKTVVDLLLPSVISRLDLLQEKGCSWLARPLLPLLMHVYTALQSLIGCIGYNMLSSCVLSSVGVSKGETKSNDSSTYHIAVTIVELEASLSNLITKMSTRMIASIPVTRNESGKASLWLESNLFSGGITDAENQSNPKNPKNPKNQDKDKDVTNASRFMYEIVVEGHEPLGLWLSDPPDGSLHDTFAPYVHGYRRVGARREPGLLERTEKVRPGHRLIGVKSISTNNNDGSITSFESVEQVYKLLKDTPRPMILTFHTLSTTNTTTYDQDYARLVMEDTKEEKDGNDGDDGDDTVNGSEMRQSSAERWNRVQSHTLNVGKQLMEDRAKLLEKERLEFCREVALDSKSIVVKWLMKSIKLKGKGKFYCMAWKGSGMYRKDLRKEQERALCAALLKHSGLWYYVKYKEHYKLKLKELTLLVQCMSNSFQELKKRMKQLKQAQNQEKENQNTTHRKASLLAPSSMGSNGMETKEHGNNGGDGVSLEKYGTYSTMIDTLDMRPLYVDAEGVLDENEEMAGVTGGMIGSTENARPDTNERPVSLEKYLERCMFMIDVIPVKVVPDEEDELQKLQKEQKLQKDEKDEKYENWENGDIASPSLIRVQGVGGLRTASSVRSIMSDPELGVNIGTQDSAHQMIMYQERFGQCIEYAFEETPSVDPLSLLNMMQVRERRGYVRSFGQLSMTSLIQNMMSVANEEKRHDQGGVLIHRYVRILLDIRAAYRGITMNESRVREEAWQCNGKWENHHLTSTTGGTSNTNAVTADSSSSSSSYLWKQHTERLHHYTTSLWAGGMSSMTLVRSSFEKLFTCIVDVLSKCIAQKNHLLKQNQKASNEYSQLVKSVVPNLNIVICSCLTALALDYEATMDSSMLLDSGLVDVLHNGFQTVTQSTDWTTEDHTSQAMWTLYRFIMMLCMGGARGESGVAGSDSSHSSNHSNAKDSNNDSSSSSSSSLSERNNTNQIPTLSSKHSNNTNNTPSLKRHDSASSAKFSELNAATKLRNKLLHFLTSELQSMVNMSNTMNEKICSPQELVLLKDKYVSTIEIMTFLVGMADVTTMMFYFGTSERVSILLMLLLVPESNIRRITALLLRYVLPMSGPAVADRAWHTVVYTLQNGTQNGTEKNTNLLKRQLEYVHSDGDFIDFIVSRIVLSWDAPSSQIGPDAISIHATECVMLMRTLYNYESTTATDESVTLWRNIIYSKFTQVSELFCKECDRSNRTSICISETDGIERLMTGLKVWMRVLGADSDTLRVGGRAYINKRLGNNSNSIDGNNSLNNTNGSSSTSQPHEQSTGATLRIVRTSPLTSTVGVVMHDDPTEIITQIDSNLLIVCEEIMLKPNSLSDEMLNQLCRIATCLATSTTVSSSSTSSSSLQHLSLLVHRTLNSPASDIGRIRNSPSSCWEELSTVAFRASNLSQFYTKEELESRHRILTTQKWRADALGPVLFNHSSGPRLPQKLKLSGVTNDQINSNLVNEEASVLYIQMKGTVSIAECIKEIRMHGVGKRAGVIGQSKEKLKQSLERLKEVSTDEKDRQTSTSKSSTEGSNGSSNGTSKDGHTTTVHGRVRKASSTQYHTTRYTNALLKSATWSEKKYGIWTPKLVYQSLELYNDKEREALEWLKQWGAFYMPIYNSGNNSNNIEKQSWFCTNCTEHNVTSVHPTACGMCMELRPKSSATNVTPISNNTNSNSVEGGSTWSCETCTFINEKSTALCTMCRTAKPKRIQAVRPGRYKLPSGNIDSNLSQRGGSSNLLRQRSNEEYDASALLNELDLSADNDNHDVIDDVRSAALFTATRSSSDNETKGESKGNGESKINIGTLFEPGGAVPKCCNGHDMVISSYAGRGYKNGYVCDQCKKGSAHGHLNGSRERWWCQTCTGDFCFVCKPKITGKRGKNANKSTSWFKQNYTSETPLSTIGGHIQGITKYTTMNTLPWKNMIVAIPKRGTLGLLNSIRDENHITISDLVDPSEQITLPLKDIRRPSEMYGTDLHPSGTLLLASQSKALDDTLSSRYARDMILRFMLSGMSNSNKVKDTNSESSESKQEVEQKETKETKENKDKKDNDNDDNDNVTLSDSSKNLEELSKLLRLVAANEGVLDGKSSDVMDSLVRAIQRTIDANEKEQRENNFKIKRSNRNQKKGKKRKTQKSMTQTNALANLIVRDCVEHIQGATVPSIEETEIRESLHPCFPGSNYEGEPIIFENARAIRISFQRNLCDLGSDVKNKTTKLTFYDKTGVNVLKVFTPSNINVPKTKQFASFTTTESHVRYKFVCGTNLKHNLHGFKIVARPLRGLGIWLNENQVLHQHSLEWACWLVDLMLNSKSNVLNQRVRDPKIIDALQKYIQKKSSPYKQRVVVLLCRLLSDVTMYERHQQYQNLHNDSFASNDSTNDYLGAPDLTLMEEMNQKILQKAATFLNNDIPVELKPILELTCVSKLGHRAFTLSEWNYGTQLPYQSEHLRTPLSPRIQSCKSLPNWKTIPKDNAMMDIIVITQCISTLQPLRIPDQLLNEIFRNSRNAMMNNSYVLNSSDLKKLEYLTRDNSKWTSIMDRELMIWIDKKSQSVWRKSPMDMNFTNADIVKLSPQDKRDHHPLFDIDSDTLRFRCALIQLLNRRMSRVMNWLDFDRAKDRWSLGYRLQSTSHLCFGALKKDIFWKGIEKTWGKGLGVGPNKTIIKLDLNKHGKSLVEAIQSSSTAPERNQNVLVQYFNSAIGQKKKPKELRSKLFVGSSNTANGHQTLWTVKYAQGQGIDYGGLYRDSLNKAASCMWHDSFSLFKRVPNAHAKHGSNQDTFMPNSTYGKSSKDLFIFCGQLIGLSIRTKGYNEVRFPPCFYKLLSGAPLDRSDLATLDFAEYWNDSSNISATKARRHLSLEQFEANDGVGCFEVENIAGKKIELVPGGKRIKVRFENLIEFCDLYDNFRLHEFDDAVLAIQIGLASIVPLKPLRLFTPSEFEELVVGRAEFDVELWKERTKYSGKWKANSIIAKRFWRVLEAFTEEQKSDVVLFGWGRSRLPDRHSEWRFTLSTPSRNDDAHLPNSHTCFFTIEMPTYSSDSIMRKRILTAITFCKDVSEK